MSSVEAVLVALIVSLLTLLGVAWLIWPIRRRQEHDKTENSAELEVSFVAEQLGDGLVVRPTSTPDRAQPVDLLTIRPFDAAGLPAVPDSDNGGTWAVMLATFIDTIGGEQLIQLMSRGQYVLVEMPARHGRFVVDKFGRALPVIRNDLGQFAGNGRVVGGASGAVAGLPAFIAAAGAAYAHHQLMQALSEVKQAVKSVEARLVGYEAGAVDGAQRLLDQLMRSKDPAAWPAQTRTELAVRTARLDEVVLAQLGELEQLLVGTTTSRDSRTGVSEPDQRNIQVALSRLAKTLDVLFRLRTASVLAALTERDQQVLGFDDVDRLRLELADELQLVSDQLKKHFERNPAWLQKVRIPRYLRGRKAADETVSLGEALGDHAAALRDPGDTLRIAIGKSDGEFVAFPASDDSDTVASIDVGEESVAPEEEDQS